MSKLRELSDAAVPGRLYATSKHEAKPLPEDHPDYDWRSPEYTMTGADSSGCLTVSTDPAYGGWETDSGCSGYGLSRDNAEFIAELWNAYREGRLVEVGQQSGKATE